MKLSVLIYTDTKINLCVASGKTKKIYTTKEEVAFLFLLFMSVVYSVCFLHQPLNCRCECSVALNMVVFLVGWDKRKV